MIDVELAPEARASLQAMADKGDAPPRCRDGAINSAVGHAVTRLLSDDLSGIVRPWHLDALRRGAEHLGDVTSARVVAVDADAAVVELIPAGQRILFRGVDDGWRLVRFVDGDDISLRPETTRRVALEGWGPDSVLTALGLVKPEGVKLEVVDEYQGQGQTETSHRYQWTDDAGRSIVAEQITNEIFDGATPRWTYVRGVIIDGDRGVLLHGDGDSALVTEG
ncbi:MAG TPA: hypothetical protein VJR50_24000 [Mycobacterium sp.]|nr:hypothetical protein [Mycobacterium sp.]